MSAVIVSLRVPASPEEAFDIFTGEIAAWWQPGALFQLTPRGDGTLSFEDEARLITTLASGKVFEIGRVTTWQRGQRLAFTWRPPLTSISSNTSRSDDGSGNGVP